MPRAARLPPFSLYTWLITVHDLPETTQKALCQNPPHLGLKSLTRILIQARFDVVNLTDNWLRDGSGVGVNAAQFGTRRGFVGSLSYAF